MALRNKFLHFKTKASYTAERNKYIEDAEKLKQFDAFTCFVAEGPTIYVFNREYKCDIGYKEVLEEIKKEQDRAELKEGEIVDVINNLINAITYESGRAKKAEEELSQNLTRTLSNDMSYAKINISDVKYDYKSDTISVNANYNYYPTEYIDVNKPLTINVANDKLNNAKVIVFGSRSVMIKGESIIKEANIDLNGDSSEYRIYSFNKIGDKIVVNCNKYN